jgi:phage shock protein C
MKRLYRSRTDRKLAGVIGGIAQYFQFDPSLLRVIFLVLLICTGFFPVGLAYLVAVYLIPNEEDVSHP